VGPGQDLALSLLSFIGKLIVVGFGMQKNQLHDLQAHGV
jgi:hypothetical protein